MPDSRETLRRALRSDDAVLDELTDAESAQLYELLQHARRRQQTSLDESIDVALRYLPRLARGPARKILFG